MSNIVLKSNGAWAVTDFGTVATVDGAFRRASPCTTAYVRAPEQVLGDPNLTPMQDMWAVGICSLAFLTGTRPTHISARGPADGSDEYSRRLLEAQIE